VSFSLYGTMLAGGCIALGLAIPRMPRVFARLAFVPVGEPVFPTVPRRAVQQLGEPQAARTTYRSAPSTKLSLASLPGDARVGGTDFVHDELELPIAGPDRLACVQALSADTSSPQGETH
jgi:hypothetical protein